jgi:hypothetical protein
MVEISLTSVSRYGYVDREGEYLDWKGQPDRNN